MLKNTNKQAYLKIKRCNTADNHHTDFLPSRKGNTLTCQKPKSLCRMLSPDLLKSFMHVQLLETHWSQTAGWDFYQLSVSFGAKNGQCREAWREAVNQTGTTINGLLSQNYHDKAHGDHYSLYDNPLFAATVWGLENCCHKHLLSCTVALFKTITRNYFGLQSSGILATHSKQRCLKNKNATVRLHKVNKLWWSHILPERPMFFTCCQYDRVGIFFKCTLNTSWKMG